MSDRLPCCELPLIFDRAIDAEPVLLELSILSALPPPLSPCPASGVKYWRTITNVSLTTIEKMLAPHR